MPASDEVRALNQKIAADYSTHVYDPGPLPFLDADRLFGQAALFGRLGRPTDVLDLGCGTAAQLARIAGQLDGRVIGTDLSPEPVRMARENLSPFGDRAEVLSADLLDLDAAELGEFDLILNVGVIYVAPEGVQRHIFELIGQCLRPGGVAVISYHTGSLPALRTHLYGLLRAGFEDLPLSEAVASARMRAEQLAEALAGKPATDLQRMTLAVTTEQSDLLLYHEIFNPCFRALQTSAVAADLARFGLDFAWYLWPSYEELPASSFDRSVKADFVDFVRGQYRYAVFGRYLNSPGACDVTTDQVCWESTLIRDNVGEFNGEQCFRQSAGGEEATMRSPASVAMLDCLVGHRLDWAELVNRVRVTLYGQQGQLSTDELAVMEGDIRLLWQHGLLKPIYRM